MAGLLGNLLSLTRPVFWRQQYARWCARRFDRRFGVETSRVVPVSAIRDVDVGLASHAVHYEPSTLPKFERALRAVAIDYPRYTFIDYGAGKGRVLMLAARHPFRQVIGVEMSAALNAAAAANIKAFRAHGTLAAPIELVCADARQLALPDGDIVAYFYNPFDDAILHEVWARLRAGLEQRPRSLIVVYVNPLHRKVFDAATELRCVFENEQIAVYRN